MLRLKSDDVFGTGAREKWEASGVRIPSYDAASAWRLGRERPVWAHFGAGNIFRGFIAKLQNELLELKIADRGIAAIETFDFEIIDKIYRPYDNLTLTAGLRRNGSVDLDIVASVAEALRADRDRARMAEIFRSPSLELASFTITEKGYALTDASGDFTAPAKSDLAAGPGGAAGVMSVVTSLLWERYCAGAASISLVSMDNCSRNGERLRAAVMAFARGWLERGFVNSGFVSWLEDETRVAYPWSMIDKITPRPSEHVRELIRERGIEDLPSLVTSRDTFIAPFVNAEIPQYLVVEDKFPAGRPALEKAGVYFAGRETVSGAERMKVTACLNPLHTALAVCGCLLGYKSIWEEMGDETLKALAERIGYAEGLPVVEDPGIFKPADFLKEVLEERFPNPYIPDTPQRIATDTSQKISIRFGETIKSYVNAPNLNASDLTGIPLAIAAWFRYLLGVDDNLRPAAVSDDPMFRVLQKGLSGIEAGRPESYSGQLEPFLANETIFAIDLYKAGLAKKVEAYFISMLQGPGAVRYTLEENLKKGG